MTAAVFKVLLMQPTIVMKISIKGDKNAR
jgi:hypothetical protein